MSETYASLAQTFLADPMGGESIRFYPGSGRPRMIQAMVDRNPPERMAAGAQAPEIEIVVENHAVRGIASNELDTGADAVEIAARIGGPTSRRMIARMVDHDEAMMTLEIR